MFDVKVHQKQSCRCMIPSSSGLPPLLLSQLQYCYYFPLETSRYLKILDQHFSISIILNEKQIPSPPSSLCLRTSFFPVHKSWSLSSAEPWQVFHTSGIRAKYIDQPKNALISLKIYAGSFIIHEISNTHNSKLRMHYVVSF